MNLKKHQAQLSDPKGRISCSDWFGVLFIKNQSSSVKTRRKSKQQTDEEHLDKNLKIWGDRIARRSNNVRHNL